MRTQLTRRAFLSTGAAASTLVLSACAFGGMAPVTFDLATVAAQAPLSRRTSRTLLVLEPTAIDTYNTERIVVREAGGVLSYLPESQWSDRMPALLRRRMEQSFEDRGVSNIARTGDRVDIQIALATDVRAFELDAGAGNLASVTISARLIDEVAGRIIATRGFTAQVPAASLDSANVVAALDAAMRDVVNQIIVWTTATV